MALGRALMTVSLKGQPKFTTVPSLDNLKLSLWWTEQSTFTALGWRWNTPRRWCCSLLLSRLRQSDTDAVMMHAAAKMKRWRSKAGCQLKGLIGGVTPESSLILLVHLFWCISGRQGEIVGRIKGFFFFLISFLQWLMASHMSAQYSAKAKLSFLHTGSNTTCTLIPRGGAVLHKLVFTWFTRGRKHFSFLKKKTTLDIKQKTFAWPFAAVVLISPEKTKTGEEKKSTGPIRMWTDVAELKAVVCFSQQRRGEMKGICHLLLNSPTV